VSRPWVLSLLLRSGAHGIPIHASARLPGRIKRTFHFYYICDYGKDAVDRGQLSILRVEMVDKMTIYGYYSNKKNPFLKITAALPKYISKAKDTYHG
jgi:hypothetical protein